MGQCRTNGGYHQVRTAEYFHPDRGYAPWLACLNCQARLWGLYRIEEDPW